MVTIIRIFYKQKNTKTKNTPQENVEHPQLRLLIINQKQNIFIAGDKKMCSISAQITVIDSVNVWTEFKKLNV